MSKATSIWEEKRKIRHGEPIECLNLMFYPITMAYYEEYLEVKNAWVTRLTSLPVQYAIMPFLSALWAMEYDSVTQNQKVIGLFERVLHLLYLSLRLEYDRKEAFKTIYYFKDSPRTLSHILISQNGNNVKITPQDFAAYIRPLVAQQNGLEVPDESLNPELVEADYQYTQSKNKISLVYDINTLIASVAYQSQLDEKVIDNWTVLQFERRYKAIERDKYFNLYKMAELTGMIKFPKGNPCPSWCYDIEKQPSILRSTDDVSKNVAAIGDVKTAISTSHIKKQGDN